MASRLTIIGRMERVARERGKIPAPLKDDLVLADGSLDSLGLAVLVARPERAQGIDPFPAAADAFFPVTLGDFVRVCEHGGR